MPINAGETFNEPIFDVYVNGQHFALTTAKLKRVSLRKFDENGMRTTWSNNPNLEQDPNRNANTKDWNPSCGSSGCMKVYSVTPNHPAIDRWDSGCAQCFDLDRDGDVDVGSTFWDKFAWQWQVIDATKENLEQNKYQSIDLDGDLREESVLEVLSDVGGAANEVLILDPTDGDIDFASRITDPNDPNYRPLGLTNDVDVYSFTCEKDFGVCDPENQTYLLIEEGKLYTTGSLDDKQVVRTVQKKDQIDIIQRQLWLSNNTGRFCYTDPDDGIIKKVDGGDNPVEVCCDTGPCCFTPGKFGNIIKTCMDYNEKVIFIRSKISDKRGRKWITDVSNDPVVNFMKQ